ncbi:hypothetical protein AAZX31_02G105000 [Glycine max]
MAEAVLEIVLENLNSLVQKELGLFLGFNQDMARLASLLITIKATLEDAVEKQFSNRAVKDWLGKLKDAAHILDDILDEFKSGLSHKVQGSLLSSFHPKHIVFRYKIAKKMKRMSERLDEIADERTKFHLVDMVLERRSGVIEWCQTTSFITEPQVYGREEDKDKIVDFFVVANYFELRIWVCVLEDFSLKRMTKAITEATSGCHCEDLDIEPLQRELQALLQRKRYLLVLDDVWDDEQENWRRLKSVLVYGTKGSSILVTTRLLKVTTIMELFKHRAFRPNEVEQVEFVVIGKEIVRKEKNEWLYVKESNLQSLPHSENFIMSALRLSYLNLPTKLRQCFAYSNGFISCNEILDAYDVGDDVERNEFGGVTSFKMHDLVHDLAQFVVGEITLKNPLIESNCIQLHPIKSLRKCTLAHPLSGHALKCYWLRVLHYHSLGKLLSSIGHLKHLRYLNLCESFFESLESLYNCICLQKFLPLQIRKLTSLRSLTTYFVGKEKGFFLEELGALKLKGDLHIEHLGKVKNVKDAKELCLSSDENEESNLQENVEEIFVVLQPDTQQLKSLGMFRYNSAASFWPHFRFSPSPLKTLSFSRSPPNQSQKNNDLESVHRWIVVKFEYHGLVIGSCREIGGLHEALQHMTALHSLQLYNLSNLEYL